MSTYARQDCYWVVRFPTRGRFVTAAARFSWECPAYGESGLGGHRRFVRHWSASRFDVLLDWRRHHRKMKPQEGQTHPSKTSRTSAGALTVQWAGSRERISPSGRGKTFFLTSLFIELIESGLSVTARRELNEVSGSLVIECASPTQLGGDCLLTSPKSVSLTVP